MQKKAQFKNGYTFNRVINGCWQLSAEHCLPVSYTHLTLPTNLFV